MSSDNDENERLQKMIEEIVYPEREPEVINKAMIEDCYLNVYEGECARLHQMEPIVFDRINEIRFEGRNIIQIDGLLALPNLTKLSICRNKLEYIENLEMLVNLKELDLSFNYITRIENLEKLEKLEVLSLFHNCITRVENVDSLENLKILSLGDNLIGSVDGMERFRFMKNLRVLNLEGNPIADSKQFNLTKYIIALVPQLKFYAYLQIDDTEREKAREEFLYEIRAIEESQENELTAIEQKEKGKLDIKKLEDSFVENLDGYQLFDMIFEEDVDGKALLSVGKVAEELVERYKEDMFEITQELYKFGLECYEEREIEVKDFLESLEESQGDIQKMGQRIIEDFLEYKDEIFEECTTVLKQLELRTIRGEDENSPYSIELAEKHDAILLKFDDYVSDTWQRLMVQELHLHETTEEVYTNFQRKLQELLSKFVEQSQGMFATLRELAVRFSEDLTEIVSRFIQEKSALRDFEAVPEELKPCLTDREFLTNLVAGMKDIHTLHIDEREDRLMTRSREYVEDFNKNLSRNELHRHRTKLLEINSFLELLSDNLVNLQQEIHDELAEEDA